MITINVKDLRPLYLQIVDGVKEQVLKGILVSGDKIPSVRQLAGELSITPNTVSKAYQELERQGVIETLRGKGTFIAESNSNTRNEAKIRQVKEELKKLCVEWQYTGSSKEEMINEIEKIYLSFERGENNAKN